MGICSIWLKEYAVINASLLFQNSRLGLFSFAFIAALPVILAPLLPLVDLPGHLGRYAVQLDAGRTEQIAEWYTFTWYLVPNLGVDLIVQALGPWLGIERAVRLAVIASVLLTALGIQLIALAAHGRVTAGALLAMPLIYSYPFLYGFLNFSLGLGMALCGIALWMRSASWKPLGRWPIFALIACVLWACHLVAFGIFAIAAGSIEISRQLTAQKLIQASWRTAVSLTFLLVPLVLGAMFGPESDARGQTDFFFVWHLKARGLLWTLRDNAATFDMATLGIISCAMGFAWFSRKMRLDAGLAMAVAILTMLVIALPHRMLGSEFADVRLLPATLMLALLAPRAGEGFPVPLQRVLLLAALALFSSRIAYNGHSMWQRGSQADVELSVLESLPPGAQLITLRARRCDLESYWAPDWQSHYAGYALLRRGAFASDQWQIPGAQLLRVHNPEMRPFETDPSQLISMPGCKRKPTVEQAVARIPRAATHLWIVWSGEPIPIAGWTILAERDRSILYTR